jgi:cytochrome c oxidase assembly protein subunit 15
MNGNLFGMRGIRFETWARWVLYYVVLVIVWGAMVRATGSGAGCGAHWPTCHGDVVPLAPTLKTWIEFSHRLTSGLSLLAVGGLALAAFRCYPVGSVVRKSAVMSLIFILGEAAVGAMLVLLRLVENDTSALRAVVIALHLVNTFFLLFWLTKTDQWARFARGEPLPPSQLNLTTRHPSPAGLLPLLGLYMLVGASGAIVALGDTLFPSESLISGIMQDFSPTAHFLIKLRVIHPVLAVVTAVVLGMFLRRVLKNFSGHRFVESKARIAGVLLIVQVSGGFLNWVLLAPIGMQIFHLVVADLVWIELVRLYVGMQAQRIS